MATELDNLGDLQRTHTCGELRAGHDGETVVLMGWVARWRDFGPLTFFDLRDREGLTQIVFDEEDAPAAHAKAKTPRGEYVVAVRGRVVLRDEASRNPKIATGGVEVRADELWILNDARTTPFQLEVASTETLASEDVRLKYRYLDLRRPQLQANLRLRAKAVGEIRRYMDEQGFTEIETPILIKSTPEGARDYVVPSRLHAGKFYALPQSPQLFKQLCMIAGFRYGSDKPDVRFGMELQDLSAALRGTDFAPFASALEGGGEVKGITVAGGAGLSRKQLDELQEFARRYGAGALAWVKLGDELSSSLLKALGAEVVARVAQGAGAAKGDAVLVVAGKAKTVAAALGALRVEIARREKLIPEGVFKPLWVTEFPMFEFNEGDGRYYAMHHPFTSPLDDDLPLMERAIENGETELFADLRAKAYDAVINGIEVAGGSIRIHRRDVQRLIFKALGMDEETARRRFGFFLEALEYGTPPHGGIASGIERLLMALVPTDNIRDVMAFPKTASAADLMIDAPGEVDDELLKELRVRVVAD
ncbi:MAG: aspartate--tRNA ligase [Acidobacteria bacterium]|nr:aspartate--tRNA ligase [Acidobacteriota bacterium]